MPPLIFNSGKLFIINFKLSQRLNPHIFTNPRTYSDVLWLRVFLHHTWIHSLLTNFVFKHRWMQKRCVEMKSLSFHQLVNLFFSRILVKWIEEREKIKLLFYFLCHLLFLIPLSTTYNFHKMLWDGRRWRTKKWIGNET